MESLIEILRIDPLDLATLLLAVFVGAVIQGAIGFGLNLVVVPVAAVLQPEALPASMIIMAIPMTAGSALREHAEIDRVGVLWTTIGRIPGVALGVLIVTTLETAELALLTGGFVVLAALMSIAAPPLRVRPVSAGIAGCLGGLMGTASSIGGPPIALLYQHEPGPVVRSTLGAAFFIGTLFSIGALQIAGEVDAWHWLLGLALTPAIALGLVVSRWMHARLDAGWLRPCVLGFAICAGLGVLFDGLSVR